MEIRDAVSVLFIYTTGFYPVSFHALSTDIFIFSSILYLHESFQSYVHSLYKTGLRLARSY
jgi:hypothetical protein